MEVVIYLPEKSPTSKQQTKIKRKKKKKMDFWVGVREIGAGC